MAKRISGNSPKTSDSVYLRKLLWYRLRWVALVWCLVVLVFSIFRDDWAKAKPREIAAMIFMACIWLVILMLIPLVNKLIAVVLSPRKDYEPGPCYDIALAQMHRGNYLAAKYEFLKTLDDFTGDRFCYESLVEIMTLHIPEAEELERLLKHAQMELPPSAMRDLKELAESYRKKVEDLQNTSKKKLDVDFIYDSELPDSVFNDTD